MLVTLVTVLIVMWPTVRMVSPFWINRKSASRTMFGSLNEKVSFIMSVIAGLLSANVAVIRAPAVLTLSDSSNDSVLLAAPPRPFEMKPLAVAVAEVLLLTTVAR